MTGQGLNLRKREIHDVRVHMSVYGVREGAEPVAGCAPLSRVPGTGARTCALAQALMGTTSERSR
ncbi:hypothetical protein CP967_13445 [Streptomyces nitrosporeus]|uniref:Uncharacterized protein n=1 Tax=Streptomyces nitrosporeus TaxID=28894 RepID=A0A5J6FBH5_9ACTN|nr:hypothetical protein CP967_13445 [Streptomyces nitrosporeus]GGZ13248.1 hypothetical protein GCM10010327_50220 [Streptomyces nitrosporeus]